MSTKRIKPVSVQMYFSQDTLKVYEDLKQVAKVTGLSLSDVAYIGFVTGFPMVREGLVKNAPSSKLLPKSKTKK
jgi:hypothetical protein